MNITVLTLFPSMFEGFATNSIIKRALGKGVASFQAVDIRAYTKDKYGRRSFIIFYHPFCCFPIRNPIQ